MNKPAIGRGGKWSERVPFHIYDLQEAAAAATFNVHKTELLQPTQILDNHIDPVNLSEGFINRIHFRIKDVAGADTYTLRLYNNNTDGSTAPYQLQLEKIWESDPLRLSDQEYDVAELNIPFKLQAVGVMYYTLEWATGAAPAGNVQGYLEVSGETIK